LIKEKYKHMQEPEDFEFYQTYYDADKDLKKKSAGPTKKVQVDPAILAARTANVSLNQSAKE
jgi:hypothetical protein